MATPDPTVSAPVTSANVTANQTAAAKLGVTVPGSTAGLQSGNSPANAGKPGFDTYGNPVSGTPLATGGSDVTNPGTVPTTTPGAAPVVSPYYSRLGPAPTPFVAQTQEEIDQQDQQNAQSLIDSINAEYDSDVANQTTVNEAATRGTDATSTLNGLGGSTDATNAANVTAGKNSAAIAAINNQREAAIQGVLSKISDSAQAQANTEQTQQEQSTKDQQDYATKVTADATSQLQSLATAHGGVTLDGLKATLTPDEYTYLVNGVGGEAQANAILFDSRPKSTLVGTPQVFGNQVFQAYNDPTTNTVQYESVPLPTGVDPSGIQSIEKTNNGVFIIMKDGTWKTIAGSGTTPTTPKDTKITIAEAKSSGLPLSVVGQSETDIVNSLSSATIPKWFTDKSAAEGISPSQETWNTYRQTISSSFGGSSSSGGA